MHYCVIHERCLTGFRFWCFYDLNTVDCLSISSLCQQSRRKVRNQGMNNVLLKDVEYRIQTTRLGVWRTYLYSSGAVFREFRSHRTIWGTPLLHYTRGICPETGKRIVAKGIIAVGRISLGVVALGQMSMGCIALGQVGAGLLAMCQASFGLITFGQLSVGFLIGVGQISTGLVAVGQLAFGRFVLAQLGIGDHVWSVKHQDPEAVDYFKSLLMWLKDLVAESSR